MIGVAAAASLLVSTSVFAETLSTSEVQVTSSSAIETTPTLGDDGVTSIVVYSSFDLATGLSQVFYQRLVGTTLVGSPVTVSSDFTDDRLNDVSGGIIVYTAFIPGTAFGRITMYRISSGSTTSLSDLAEVGEARIHGNNVAWVEGASGDGKERVSRAS